MPNGSPDGDRSTAASTTDPASNDGAVNPRTAAATAPIVDVAEAVRSIGAGGVVAYPTEAVFGIGCDPSSVDALRRVLAIKGRAPEKGFILVASERRQLAPWLAPLEPAWRSRMDLAWPGPVTFIVPASWPVPADRDAQSDADSTDTAAALLRGGRRTIAVRVSDHPVVRALCEGCGHPLVSTSANLSGRPALRTAEAVAREFAKGSAGLDAIVAGETGGRRTPSDIVDVRTGRRLR